MLGLKTSFYPAVRTGSSNPHFFSLHRVLFLSLTTPDFCIRSAKQIFVAIFCYTAWNRILSDRNKFCTLRGGRSTAGIMLLGLSLLLLFFWKTLHLIYVVSSKASPYIVNTIFWKTLRRGKRPSSFTISSSMSDRGALPGSENQTGGRRERKVDLVSGTRLPLGYPQGSNPGLDVTCE